VFTCCLLGLVHPPSSHSLLILRMSSFKIYYDFAWAYPLVLKIAIFSAADARRRAVDVLLFPSLPRTSFSIVGASGKEDGSPAGLLWPAVVLFYSNLLGLRCHFLDVAVSLLVFLFPSCFLPRCGWCTLFVLFCFPAGPSLFPPWTWAGREVAFFEFPSAQGTSFQVFLPPADP